jgi:alkylation response protein AidB-like acyl-CoA dehydrogenase
VRGEGGLEGEEAYSDSREARQRKKARVICLGVRGFVRLSVEKPLAFGSAEQNGRAFRVLDPELGTVAISETRQGSDANGLRTRGDRYRKFHA